MNGKVILLTGEKKIGKSTLCRKVCDWVRARGYKPAGIVCPALYDSDKRKRGFMAEDVRTGRQWVLGTRERKLSGQVYGPYTFSRSGLQRAVHTLKRAPKKGYDLLVLDEVGPLEMERGEGFRSALDMLKGQKYVNLLIVVRPSLIEEVKTLFEGWSVTVVTANMVNRDDLPERILQLMR
jgi:nucleoside-triphosphatase THEP1